MANLYTLWKYRWLILIVGIIAGALVPAVASAGFSGGSDEIGCFC